MTRKSPGTNGLLAPLSGMSLRAIPSQDEGLSLRDNPSSCGFIYQRVTHMLHVWNIYLRLPQKSPKYRQIFHTWSIWVITIHPKKRPLFLLAKLAHLRRLLILPQRRRRGNGPRGSRGSRGSREVVGRGRCRRWQPWWTAAY